MTIALSGCASAPDYPSSASITDPILLGKQHLSHSQEQANQILNLISQGELAAAQQHFDRVNKNPSHADEAALISYTHAKLLLAQHNPAAALAVLDTPAARQANQASAQTQLQLGLLHINILTQQGLYLQAAKRRTELSPLLDADKASDNNRAIWSELNQSPYDEISEAADTETMPTFRQWLALNTISRNRHFSAEDKMAAIEKWQQQNPLHPASIAAPTEVHAIIERVGKQRQKIAVLLPFKGKYSAIAEAIRDGILYSYYLSGTEQEIRFYTASENGRFIDTYRKAVADGAKLVIGPLFKNQVEELYQLEQLPVLTLALNRLDKPGKPGNLYEFSLAPEDEVLSIIEHASKSGRNNALVLAQQDEFSQKNLSIFINNWQDMGHNIIATHSFATTTDLAIELEKPLKLHRSTERIKNLENLLGVTLKGNPKSRTDIDMVVIFSKSDSAREINTLLDYYFPNTLAKYANSSIYRELANPRANSGLDGIMFTDTALAINPENNPSPKYRLSPLLRMYAFGIDAMQLGSNITSMSAMHDTLKGATGFISLNNGVLLRKTPFALFADGHARPLPELAEDH